MALDRAVRVHQQHVHRAFTGLRVFVISRPDGQVGHAVAVEISQAGQRAAEGVKIIEAAGGKAGQAVADLGVALDRAVRVHQQHVHRAFTGLRVFVI